MGMPLVLEYRGKSTLDVAALKRRYDEELTKKSGLDLVKTRETFNGLCKEFEISDPTGELLQRFASGVAAVEALKELLPHDKAATIKPAPAAPPANLNNGVPVNKAGRSSIFMSPQLQIAQFDQNAAAAQEVAKAVLVGGTGRGGKTAARILDGPESFSLYLEPDGAPTLYVSIPGTGPRQRLELWLTSTKNGKHLFPPPFDVEINGGSPQVGWKPGDAEMGVSPPTSKEVINFTPPASLLPEVATVLRGLAPLIEQLPETRSPNGIAVYRILRTLTGLH